MSPVHTSRMTLRRVCVFCGSSLGNRDDYRTATVSLAAELVSRGINLVYGGACVGLMGLLADEVHSRGGEMIGVMPRSMVDREVAHRGLTDLRIVESMHERKAAMAALADAFIALPGGFGTFEEFCEAVTWTQLGLHQKRCGLLNVAGFYDPLLTLFDRAVADGFLRPENRKIVAAEAEPPALLNRLSLPPERSEPKWLTSLAES
jgi:uncharacterized protein (TIGR00730 family)